MRELSVTVAWTWSGNMHDGICECSGDYIHDEFPIQTPFRAIVHKNYLFGRFFYGGMKMQLQLVLGVRWVFI